MFHLGTRITMKFLQNWVKCPKFLEMQLLLMLDIVIDRRCTYFAQRKSSNDGTHFALIDTMSSGTEI